MSQKPIRPTLFFSYARQDGDYADRLEGDLQAENIDIWRDQRNIQGGDDWEEKIRSAIRASSSVLYLGTPSARASEAVRGELTIAKEYKKPIHPVFAVGKVWADAAPLVLIPRHYFDIREGNYQEGVKHLVDRIKQQSPSNFSVDSLQEELNLVLAEHEQPLAHPTDIPRTDKKGQQISRRSFLRVGAGVLGLGAFVGAVIWFHNTYFSSPATSTWEIHAGDSYIGYFNIIFQNDNKILGDVFEDPLIGSWDPNAKKIFFLRATQTDFSSFQVYRGAIVDNNNIRGTATSYDREKLIASPPFHWFAQYKSSNPIDSINMPGPTSQKFQNWKIQIDNGQSGTLNILNINNDLIISGNVLHNPLIGYWDNQVENGEIIFFSSLSQDFSSFQIYQGVFQNNTLKGKLKKYTATSTIQFFEQADWQAHP